MSNALLEALGASVSGDAAACPVRAYLAGRRIYHAAPLHYLPSILCSGRLVSARLGKPMGIAPRSSAARRDRMLGVDDYVHLAFDLLTPLLADKLRRGMPHVALVFDAARIYEHHQEECALLPCNTKAYRSRAACQPESGPLEMASLLKARAEFHRHPSLEFLVWETLPLGNLVEVTTFCERDAALVRALLHALRPEFSGLLAERHAPGYVQLEIVATQDYCHACIAAQTALMPPPKIAFD